MILRLYMTGNFWYSDLMRLLFVADGRSPIAVNWMRYFVERGDEVHLASTFNCSPDLALNSSEIIPVAFSGSAAKAKSSRRAAALPVGFTTAVRHLLGPLTIPRAARRLRAYADVVKPDLVHAMRIPFEGMLAADAYGTAPLVVSVWGNDFTLHAPAAPLMRHYTSWTMGVADALHADCRRDVRLARQWGLATAKPTLVVPGAGGIRPEIFHPGSSPASRPIIINARGARAYVRNDVFLRAFAQVLDGRSDARCICVGLADDPSASRLIGELRIGHAVELLPQLTQPELADQFRRSQVMVSPSVHDGTPNSLLEGMACGCFPVAGDLESIREWITPGENGLLVDATDPLPLAQAILRSLEDEDLRRRAAGLNRNIIEQRAQYARCMSSAGEFYARVAAGAARQTRAMRSP